MNENRVIVAMSGGVDSSVAAALLVQQGYEIIGITMKTWGFMEVGGAPKHESGCCSLDAVFDAKSVASKLNAPHYTFDFSESFENEVIDNFVDEYLHGRTPNPCVICNRKIKWEELLKKADTLEAKYIATGHYANVVYDNETNRYKLKTGKDTKKDQSYALWGLTQDSLSRTIFPLADYTKEEVRKLAADFGLKTAKKPDSQEICFVADNNYERFLREKSPEIVENIKSGDLIYKGKKVGSHKGIPFYTIGQRKGLGLAFGKPAYVTHIDFKENKIYVGDKEELLKYELDAEDINYVSSKSFYVGEKVFAKIRYMDNPASAEITFIGQDKLSLKFENPKLSITPGQSLSIYDKDGFVLAGGIISKSK
ncbi:MAG: tRNA 2-thiouridine(34) synthase MnmA [bacterium]